ncbi:MAG: hypothetical protein R2788_19880 [Saprospiraceae bacterium]
MKTIEATSQFQNPRIFPLNNPDYKNLNFKKATKMIKQLPDSALLSLFSCDTSKRAFYRTDEEQDWQNAKLPTDPELEQTLFSPVGWGKVISLKTSCCLFCKELSVAGKKYDCFSRRQRPSI